MTLGRTARGPIVSGLDVVAGDLEDDQLRYIRTTDIMGLSALKSGSALGVDKSIVGSALVAHGDLLMTRSGSLGTSYLHDGAEPMAYAGYLVKYRPNTEVIHPRYVAWWTQSRDHLDQVSVGAVRSTIDNFSAKKFSLMSVPVPPLETQRSIADFLNRETAKIDAVIEKQRALVDGLRNRRNSMIQQATTGGHWPVDRRSQTGLGWLPTIPDHWEICRAKELFSERSERNTADDVHLTPSQNYGVLPQSEYMEITGSRVVLNLTAQDNMKHVEAGDFISHLRSFQGGLERTEMSGKVSTAYTVLQPSPKVHGPYFKHLMKSGLYVQALRSSTNQLRDGQSIRYKEIRAIPLPLPPMDEQVRIAEHIEQESARIDSLTARSERLIELSHERRSALITAAVTGQIDIATDTKTLDGAA